MANFIAQMELVFGYQNGPRTAAQVASMSTQQLLQDPVRAAIYNRGWVDRTVDIQNKLQPKQPVASHPYRTLSLIKLSQPQPPKPAQQTPSRPMLTTAAITVSGLGLSTPRDPAMVTGTSGVRPTTGKKVRTEAQQARNRRKFRQLKEKRLAKRLFTEKKKWLK